MRFRGAVAAVHLPNVTDEEFEASLTELGQLAKTLGFEVVATFTQKRSNFDGTTAVINNENTMSPDHLSKFQKLGPPSMRIAVPL